MFKLVVLFALVAIAAARPGLIGSHLEYSAPASGYAYSATVQAEDYVNHVSVNSPLAVDTAPLIRSYPAIHSAYISSPYLAPSIHAYSAPLVHY